MQLMIYVGGTMVLLVFGVMLTARGPFVSMKTRGGEWVLAAIVGGSLLAVLLQAAFSVDDWRGRQTLTDDGAVEIPSATDSGAVIGMPLLGMRPDAAQPSGANNNGVRSGYLLPFEIVSVHLLVVLIGASYLARTKRRVRKPDSTE